MFVVGNMALLKGAWCLRLHKEPNVNMYYSFGFFWIFVICIFSICDYNLLVFDSSLYLKFNDYLYRGHFLCLMFI